MPLQPLRRWFGSSTQAPGAAHQLAKSSGSGAAGSVS
jgi:hypothetical protein